MNDATEFWQALRDFNKEREYLSDMQTNVFTIKLTHLTTGEEKVVPITRDDFNHFVTWIDVQEGEGTMDKLLSDIMQRTDIEKNWFDNYEVDGIFVGTLELSSE